MDDESGTKTDQLRRGRPPIATQTKIFDAIKQALDQKGSFTHQELRAAVGGGSLTTINDAVQAFLVEHPDLFNKAIELSERSIKVLTAEVATLVNEKTAALNKNLKQARYDQTLLARELDESQCKLDQLTDDLELQASRNLELTTRMAEQVRQAETAQLDSYMLHEKLVRAEERLKYAAKLEAELNEAKKQCNHLAEAVAQLKALQTQHTNSTSDRRTQARTKRSVEKVDGAYSPQATDSNSKTVERLVVEKIGSGGMATSQNIFEMLAEQGLNPSSVKSIPALLRRSQAIAFNRATRCWVVRKANATGQ